jgi:hypothetical protein
LLQVRALPGALSQYFLLRITDFFNGEDKAGWGADGRNFRPPGGTRRENDLPIECDLGANSIDGLE